MWWAGVPFNANLVQDGDTVPHIDPNSLVAGRPNLIKSRLDAQRHLLRQQIARWTPIFVTKSGVIYDGNHAARAAAEAGEGIEIQVIDASAKGFGNVLSLPIVMR